MNVVRIRKHRKSDEFYYLNKQYHRLNQDKAAITWWDGYKYWYRNGIRWRENGFASIYTNGQSWYFFKDGVKQ